VVEISLRIQADWRSFMQNQDVVVAVASSCDEPAWAREAMRKMVRVFIVVYCDKCSLINSAGRK